MSRIRSQLWWRTSRRRFKQGEVSEAKMLEIMGWTKHDFLDWKLTTSQWGRNTRSTFANGCRGCSRAFPTTNELVHIGRNKTHLAIGQQINGRGREHSALTRRTSRMGDMICFVLCRAVDSALSCDRLRGPPFMNPNSEDPKC